jgi:hypothetical protein
MTVAQLRELADDNSQLMPLTVEQYHRMICSGMIEEGEPYELLDGIVVRSIRSGAGEDPMTVNPLHAWAVEALSSLNPKFTKHKAHIRTQKPISLPPYDEPEPDGAIVRGTFDSFLERHPHKGDVLCVIEVADASLRRDRTLKQRIYADSGIPIYVILNLVDRVIEEYSSPLVGKGRYARSQTLSAKQSLILPTGTAKKINVRVAQLPP